MKNLRMAFMWPALMGAIILLSTFQSATAAKYELTRNSVEDPKEIDAAMVSLFRVKLGDPEATATD